jgi:hypothetical protein
MSPHLYRLVYHSRNLIPGGPAQIAAEVERILDVSRRNNSSVGATGALIFNTGMFAQVLEGARQDIEDIFERIQRDERHGDVEVLAAEEVESRGFPSWSMAFVGRSRENESLFAHIGKNTGFEARRLDGERVFRVLRDLAIDEELRAA